ncbi:MAG: L-lactate dehydrogenase [Deltaproteobacteria bacterium]|nr:L-lactate dehydrogenase [Deltaproteobacteria bacterium]
MMGQTEWEGRKVVIIGAGAVGSTFAYALALSGIVDDIVLLDHNRELVKGQVLDLVHGLPFLPAVHIREGSEVDCRDARVIFITAGARQQPGESRLNLLRRNISIIEGIAQAIASQGSRAVIVVVSNPVDILTYAAVKKTGLPGGRVMGSGTFLDSARFRYLISRHCGVDVHNVHAYILGEHGDSEFAAWSMTHIAGMPMQEYCLLCRGCTDMNIEHSKIVEEVRDSAYHIIGYKGSTTFAIGLAMVQIVAAIVRDQHSVMAVSTYLSGEYGIQDVCLSVPCIVSGHGVEKIIEGSLTGEELSALSHSATVLKKTITGLHGA